jgi:carbon monoxide dehydrogenase subunit G
VLIENDLSVAAPPDEVYDLMLDVRRVAPCIPGAEITGEREDGGYDAQATVKLGPVTMTYRGSVTVADEDAAARSASLLARGSEARGQGTAQATMRMTVEPEGEGSRVHVATDLMITGRVAQMGKGIMQDVAARMMADMARCMETKLAGPAAAPAGETGSNGAEPAPAAAAAEPPRPTTPLSGAGLVGPVLWARVRPFVGPLAALLVFVVLVRLLRSHHRNS